MRCVVSPGLQLVGEESSCSVTASVIITDIIT